MAYSGRFRPKNPDKYKGDPNKIVYRSSWECRAFSYLDKTENIIKWSSEEIVIPYRSPVDGKMRRYFPDIFLKFKASDGTIKTQIIEIKPAHEVSPPKMPKRTKNLRKAEWRHMRAMKTYAVNKAKWAAAEKYVKHHNIGAFRILTENELFGGNKAKK